MSTHDSGPSAVDLLGTIQFRTGIKGYNADEVDDFLTRLEDEIRPLLDENNRLRQQLRLATERLRQVEAGGAPAVAPAPAPAPTPTAANSETAEQVSAMLHMAQEFIANAKKQAHDEVTALIGEAQEKARTIVTEARSRAEDEVERLNGMKQRLGEDVDTLARRLEVERQRLTSMVGEFGKWLEDNFSLRTPKTASAPAAPATPPTAAAPAPGPTAARPATPPPAPPASEAPRLDSFRDDNR